MLHGCNLHVHVQLPTGYKLQTRLLMRKDENPRSDLSNEEEQVSNSTIL